MSKEKLTSLITKAAMHWKDEKFTNRGIVTLIRRMLESVGYSPSFVESGVGFGFVTDDIEVYFDHDYVDFSRNLTRITIIEGFPDPSLFPVITRIKDQ